MDGDPGSLRSFKSPYRLFPSPNSVSNTSSTSPRFISARRFASSVGRRMKGKNKSPTITREFIILSLESLKESSPAFPPLEGAIGGLLKLVNTYETMTQNTVQRQSLYERIDNIQNNLISAWGDIDPHCCPLSTSQVKALQTFNVSLQHILEDARAILHGTSPLRRFILAREHKSQLSDLVLRLAHADDDFRRSIELDTNGRVTHIQQATSEHTITLQKLHDLQIVLIRLLLLSPILFARDSGVGKTEAVAFVVHARCISTQHHRANPSIVRLIERVQSIACPGSLAAHERLQCCFSRRHHLYSTVLWSHKPRLRGNRKAPDKGSLRRP